MHIIMYVYILFIWLCLNKFIERRKILLSVYHHLNNSKNQYEGINPRRLKVKLNCELVLVALILTIPFIFILPLI